MALTVREFWPELCGGRAPRIARSAIIHEGVVIGEPGQGFIRVEDGRLVAFPHIGGVIIGEDVEVWPNSTVCRGALTDTVIMRGSKIGNGVNIGHGAYVGEDTIICAHSTVGGSSRIGSRVTLWQSVSVKQGVVIGDDAAVGMGAVVLRDVPPGETWAGVPARKIG